MVVIQFELIQNKHLVKFIKKNPKYRLDNETYWDEGGAPQIYYMIGAWATAYLIHAKGIDEKIVLRDCVQLGSLLLTPKKANTMIPYLYGN